MKIIIKFFKKFKCAAKQALFKIIDFELFFRQAKKCADKRLLIVRIDAIGDFIIFSPMLKYYRQLYNGYRITLLINQVNEQLAAQFNSNADEILAFDRSKFSHNFFYRRKLLLKICHRRFNVAICPNFSREPLSDYLMKKIQAGEKIGCDGDLTNLTADKKKINNKFYSKLIRIDSKIISEVEKNKAFFEALGNMQADDYVPIMEISASQNAQADKILANLELNKKKFAIICLGASDIKRMWPLEKYAELIDWLKKEKKFEVIICGSKNEMHLANQLKNFVKNNIFDMVGKMDLLTLAAIFNKAVLYVGADTGPGHLAAAIGTPTVCIVGGGHPSRFFPWGDLNKNKIVYFRLPCYGCNWHCQYDKTKCVLNITVSQVIDTINKII